MSRLIRVNLKISWFCYKKVSVLSLLERWVANHFLQMWISSQKKGGYLKIFMQQARVQYAVLKQQPQVLRQRRLVPLWNLIMPKVVSLLLRIYYINKAITLLLFMAVKSTSTIWRAFSMAMALKIFGINKITKIQHLLALGVWVMRIYLIKLMKLSRNYKMKVNRFLV